ncbi:hypothetical protein D3C80_1940510 [compost metagenome]
MEDELPGFLVEHRGTEHIAGQQVGGELDALEAQPEHPRQGMAEGGLAHSGEVFDQQVTASQHAGQGQAHLDFLAQQDLIHCLQTIFQLGAHPYLSSREISDATGLA